MSQIIPINIPTYISDQNYNPTRVLPRLLFYNGLLDCESYWIESGSLNFGGVTFQQNAFPYFDNYNVVSGQFPTTGSRSLLFNNENASYGEIPNESLYTTYWEKYISLLYNPKTRLLTCEAIIPLADYVKMELNDVVNFRGNYYHLRAINDYSLKTGECNLQLLGPIIPDTLSDLQPLPPPPPTPDATASIHLEEYNASPTAFIDANLFVSGTSYFFSGDFTQSIAGGTIANVTLEGKDGGSTVWGGYTTASATLTTLNNGIFVTSSTQFIYSGSGDINITFPTTFTAGNNITISGSTNVIPTGSCCAPTITSASVSGGDISIFFTTSSVCNACTATTIQKSADGSTWGGDNTAGCSSPRVITAPTASIYYRMYQNCGALTSSFSDSYYYSTTSVFEYTGCGRGSNVSNTCSDVTNNRTFYSDCDTFDFGVGCYVYVDTFPNALTGYNNVYMNGSTWDISSVTGIVTALSSEQC